MRILYFPNEYSQQRQFEKPAHIYPIRMAMESQWYRERGHDVYWGQSYTTKDWIFDKIITEPEGLPFLELPHANRFLTRWWDYQDNGNFKYHPATYIQAANLCWYRKCAFCVESRSKESYQVRPVEDVLQEIDELHTQGFREIFDDSGTFPTGQWLYNFCVAMANKPYKMTLGCNMRICELGMTNTGLDWQLMKKAGFRMVLFGIESANQSTLDRINKGVKVEDIIPTLKKASKEGIENHVAVMFGFPWECNADADKTLRLVYYLLRKGYTQTAQASLYSCPTDKERPEFRSYCRKIYNVGFDPRFWVRQLISIRTREDLAYLALKIKKGLQR